MKTRNGMWMQTFSGRPVWPADLKPEDIDIVDVAHSLSMLCRYAGHCIRFLSVAEHSVHVASAVQPEYKLAALVHDAAESIFCDLARAVKSETPDYVALESEGHKAVVKAFGIEDMYPWPAEVKAADTAILADERAQNMRPMPGVSDEEWGATLPPLGIKLQFWSPERAEYEYLNAFNRYKFHHGR